MDSENQRLFALMGVYRACQGKAMLLWNADQSIARVVVNKKILGDFHVCARDGQTLRDIAAVLIDLAEWVEAISKKDFEQPRGSAPKEAPQCATAEVC